MNLPRDVIRSFIALAAGGEPQGGGSEEFAGYIRAEIAKWGKTIKDAKITFE